MRAHQVRMSTLRLTRPVCARIKDQLRRKFADMANDFERRLRLISTELVSIEGSLEEQTEQIRQLQTRMPAISESIQAVVAAEDECRAANVDENDYTAFTVEDLRFELELVTQSISKKLAFVDNQVRPDDIMMLKSHAQDNTCPQIVSRNMTNLTPAQLEQFESTFRYFDKDESNTLNQSEMTAALASLGIVFSVSRHGCTPLSLDADELPSRMRTWTSYTIS